MAHIAQCAASDRASHCRKGGVERLGIRHACCSVARRKSDVHQDVETLDRAVIATFREGLPEGAPDIAVTLIDLFLQEAGSQAQQLREAGRRGDTGALKSAAHNLKGSSMTMGAKRLGLLCTDVEEHAGCPSSVDAPALFMALITELDRELVNVRHALLAERERVSQG